MLNLIYTYKVQVYRSTSVPHVSLLIMRESTGPDMVITERATLASENGFTPLLQVSHKLIKRVSTIYEEDLTILKLSQRLYKQCHAHLVAFAPIFTGDDEIC